MARIYYAIARYLQGKKGLKPMRISISISISIIYLPSGTRGVVAQSPEPEAHNKSD